jgi:hypothetical protein
VRGKGAAFDLLGRGQPPGTALWGFNSVSWGFNSVARSSGPVYGAAAAVRGLAGSSGRLSLCCPEDQASCCGCHGPAARTARSWLTTLVVSAGHMRGLVGLGWCWRFFPPADCGPGRPFRVSLEW